MRQEQATKTLRSQKNGSKLIIRDTRLSLRTWNFAYTNEQANFQNGLSIFEPKLSIHRVHVIARYA